MSTKESLELEEITSENPLLSSIRSIVETAFYGNNVQEVFDRKTAYQLAKGSPGTIITDITVSHAEELDLPADARTLVFNDGSIVGRTASARRIFEDLDKEQSKYEKILREAVYQSRKRQFYHTKVIVGLSEEFSVQSHLLIPEGFENNLYSYILNFQLANAKTLATYQKSASFDEGDLYIFCDPEWTHEAFPNGLVLFDSLHNTAAVLGLRYFGELKKATLTLAWALGNRNGFIACHGGMKQYTSNDQTYTMAVFGLSGSGKSTITLAKHSEGHSVTILHDDAFVISRKNGFATALEPSYFDKTQDYPSDDPAISSFLTCQNVGVTCTSKGEKVLVTGDIRNGNGRTVKSRYATPDRVDHLSEKIDAVFWIMKDDSLPPIIKINDPVLAASFGATLATKRSDAENITTKRQLDELVIEPFANPFRVYPLREDYQAFRELFLKQQTACYVLNTGYFDDKKIKPETTLSIVERIVQQTAEFKSFGPFEDIHYLPIPDFPVSFEDTSYKNLVKQRLDSRLRFIEAQIGKDLLPDEAKESLENLIQKLN
ncbi:phosphoenolpyruvate carboxykinase (ATP) [Enterococcus faecium]|uniref:phosphoenolpyruvate carboxykinase (ATP) n=1 Tax=Enterococcus sp. (strain 3G1_DIV0629) TaxID=1834176 RepID=UPI000A33281B|nr:phosphoenolpyruvate carboxykinase (ATP) [Enterococcus sp. 3G1_DIV0629]EME7219424.1 phosphoenolpyruvate carboxykinase (ATP) [Enterococcus faecium]EME8111109.1 phosphoenolpyruvate carboxykinase (ATP) [Enterococcus faecium]EME8124344.1 phosphoenolpyruvate carboxykinase (ATP) [Enterococcus faecium]OTO27775.1 phosphoenolpyruvate carboxykinase [Enterococcus sp. 3G1_DIV0629]